MLFGSTVDQERVLWEREWDLRYLSWRWLRPLAEENRIINRIVVTTTRVVQERTMEETTWFRSFSSDLGRRSREWKYVPLEMIDGVKVRDFRSRFPLRSLLRGMALCLVSAVLVQLVNWVLTMPVGEAFGRSVGDLTLFSLRLLFNFGFLIPFLVFWFWCVRPFLWWLLFRPLTIEFSGGDGIQITFFWSSDQTEEVVTELIGTVEAARRAACGSAAIGPADDKLVGA